MPNFANNLSVFYNDFKAYMAQKIAKLENLQTRLDEAGVLNFAKILKKQHPKMQVCLVGGSVRDAILSVHDSKDYDFVVRGVDKKRLLDVLKNLGWVDLVGKKFGVYKFKPANLKIKLTEPLDIALPRTEVSNLSGAYKDFEIHTDKNLKIEEDLSRRDFTINTMAWDLFDKKLIDLFDGQNDLVRKNIKTVGKAEARFAEDYSRMLRGIRFACQLKFKIDNNTWRAIKRLMPKINKKIKNHKIIPYEVISAELLKAFISNPVQAFDLYEESGAFNQLIPEILKMQNCPQPPEYHTEGDVWQHTRLVLEKLNSLRFKNYLKKLEDKSINSNLILACLFHDMGKAYTIQTPEKDGSDRIRFNGHNVEGAKIAKNICERLKISAPAKIGAEPDKVVWLIKSHMLLLSGEIDKMRATTLEKYFFNPQYPGDDLIKLTIVDALATIPPKGRPNLKNVDKLLRRLVKLKKLNKEKNRLPAALLNGNQIMKLLGLKPGKKIGELSLKLREKQLNGKVKNKVEAKRFLKSL